MKKPEKSVTARGLDLQPARQSCDYSRRSGKHNAQGTIEQ
jgi:hypothetical protein